MKIKIITIRLIIKGKVQRVWYRGWFSKNAQNLKLSGYVKNLNNINNVEALIQGNKENVKKMIELSKIGTSMSRVDNVYEEKLLTKEIYKSFIVK